MLSGFRIFADEFGRDSDFPSKIIRSALRCDVYLWIYPHRRLLIPAQRGQTIMICRARRQLRNRQVPLHPRIADIPVLGQTQYQCTHFHLPKYKDRTHNKRINIQTFFVVASSLSLASSSYVSNSPSFSVYFKFSSSSVKSGANALQFSTCAF